ncbi:MAG: arginine--tRNA ligase [Hydrogenophilus sp.]|nr:arginine--tRNA ligase [Hydrogenophilus sp.]
MMEISSPPEKILAALLRQAITAAYPEEAHHPIFLERPKDPAHGDWTTTWAFHRARTLKQNPRTVAESIVREVTPHPYLHAIEVAGQGFINLYLSPLAKTAILPHILERRHRYGAGQPSSEKILIEFVSANPTGPLHVGHGRGAAYGAALAQLLSFAGHTVTCEYYINDAGRQIDILALSVWLRYLEHFLSLSSLFPPNAYQGDYVRLIAAELKERHGALFVRDPTPHLAQLPPAPLPDRLDPDAVEQREARLDALIALAKQLLGPDHWAILHRLVLESQLADLRADLAEFGVHFDTWFSEQSLYDTGLVARAIEQLQTAGHCYEQDGALWFRATAFGDEKDRVLRRANGSFTYFAADIAYHLNKYERRYTHLINIWGADHHGYAPRLRAALTALGLDANRLEIHLVQFAVLYRGGEKVPMSTRAGQYITLRELRQEVGNDAARIFYLMRKSDQHLDFDLDLAKKQSADNPVYYLQYAHARIASLLREALSLVTDPDPSQALALDQTLAAVDLTPLHTSPSALTLAQHLSLFPSLIQTAAQERAPHHLLLYLKEVAARFHAWYNEERILVPDSALRNARLALARATQHVLTNGLTILGVSAPTRM